MVRAAYDGSLQDEKETIVFRYVTAEYISKTQELCDTIFGKSYAKIKFSDQHQFTIIAFHNSHLVGFGTGLIVETGYYNSMQLAQVPIGILQLVGVLPDFRNFGIGIGLMQRIVKKIFPLDVFGFAWEMEGQVIADSRLSLSGLKKVNKLGYLWRDGCDKEEFQCPNRSDVCNCTAVLYSSK